MISEENLELHKIIIELNGLVRFYAWFLKQEDLWQIISEAQTFVEPFIDKLDQMRENSIEKNQNTIRYFYLIINIP